MRSTRLPRKTMALLAGQPVIFRVLERIRQAKTIEEVVVATTVHPDDDVIASFCASIGTRCHRGSEENVLERVVQAARIADADIVVQLGADCPLYDPMLIDELVTIYRSNNFDYVANDMKLTYPEGIDAHVISMEALEKSLKFAEDPRHLEDVPRYIWDHPEKFTIFNLEATLEFHAPQIRVTLDYPEDLLLLQAIYENLYPRNSQFTTRDVLDLLRERPDLAKLNAGCKQLSAAYLDN
jgi:spore coat polysaccharide biosynthesis protein SpsF